MRCLSPHGNYSLQVIEGNEQVIMDARGYAHTQTIKKPVVANFQKVGLLDYEIEAALSAFNFSGIPEGVNPLTRISSFDTEAYVLSIPEQGRDELLVQINKRLRELQARHPNEFIIVDPPHAPRPWPSYDEMTVEDILKFQEVLRIKPQEIRLYELENANRYDVVHGMLKKEDPEGAVAYEAEHLGGIPTDQGTVITPEKVAELEASEDASQVVPSIADGLTDNAKVASVDA